MRAVRWEEDRCSIDANFEQSLDSSKMSFAERENQILLPFSFVSLMETVWLNARETHAIKYNLYRRFCVHTSFG